METNETGLTLIEKIMFLILGAILLVAIGSIVINHFSSNDRNDVNTLESKRDEKVDDKKDDKKEDKKDDKKEEVLIEDESDNNNLVTYINTSYKPVVNKLSAKKEVVETKTEQKEVKEEQKEEVKEDNMGQGDTLTWDFPEGIVTKAFSGDVLYINRSVRMSNGNTEYAQVTVRKLVDDTYMIQELVDDKITLSEGLYKYYYTFMNETKELELNVYEYLNDYDMKLLSFTNEIGEDSTITVSEYTNLKQNNENSSLVKDNVVKINSSYSDEFGKIAITLKVNEEITSISSMTKGLYVFGKDNENWHESLEDNEVILVLDLKEIEKDKDTELVININGKKEVIVINVHRNTNNEDKKDKDDSEEVKNNDNNDNEEVEEDPVEPSNDVEVSNLVETLENNNNTTNVQQTLNEIDGSVVT